MLDLRLPELIGFSLAEQVAHEGLRTPLMAGFTLVKQIAEEGLPALPIIFYTGRELTTEEKSQLRAQSDRIILKDAADPERLIDETTLFLHRVEAQLPRAQQKLLQHLHAGEALFRGKKILIVDDDARNVFALTSALERHGLEVISAENGLTGVSALELNPDVDLVLMDVMMPEMDGYEATAKIRKNKRFEELPIIILTAKAMKGDREESLSSGASDYIAKPVAIEQLLSVMRVWLQDAS